MSTTEPLRVTAAVEVPVEELNWKFSRSSGPGGQHVNTSDTRVELSVDVASARWLSSAQREHVLRRLAGQLVDGRLRIAVAEYRSQFRNRQEARERLARRLREALAPDPAPRRPTKPSASARRRRADAKKRRGSLKRSRRSPGPND